MYHLEKLFNYNQKEVRVVIINDMPWFVAKDVCEILSITKHRGSIARLESDERESVLVDTLGGKQNMIAVNESGLYSLILTSRKPEAKAFKRWITHDVIPQIRVSGSYSLHNSQQFQLPMTYRDALVALVSEIDRNENLQSLNQKQQLLIQEQTPKVEMFDTFLSAEGMQSMSQVAKSLGFGRNRLYSFLRERNVLNNSTSPHKRNLPHQLYIDSGYFKVIDAPIREGDSIKITNQVLVYPKGVAFIARLLKQEQIEQIYIEGNKQMKEAGVFSESTL